LVNDKDLFCATVLPLFRHSEFASFRAQLKAYGFVRIGKSGPDKGGYYHNAFLRGRPELCATITRRPKNVNGTVRGRPKGRSSMEPDFHKMKFLPDLDVQPTPPPPGNIKDILEAALTQITPPAVVTRDVGAISKASAGKGKAAGGHAIGQTRDTSEVVAKLVQQNDTGDTTLPVKLHALLNDAHEHAFNRVANWNDAGRSFIIVDEKVFSEDLCEK
jgi:HSF-type DNA-binding